MAVGDAGAADAGAGGVLDSSRTEPLLMQEPAFRVLTIRDGQHVITEAIETEIAAWTRFTSAIDLCSTRDNAHAYRVELYQGQNLLDVWPATIA
jgi:hypothetical protein